MIKDSKSFLYPPYLLWKFQILAESPNELLEVVLTLAFIGNSFAGREEISGDRWTNRGW